MELVVSETSLGTSEPAWAASGRLRKLPPLRDLHPGRVVVVAPHPDDEVFGTAGLVQDLLARGIPLSVVAVTDGEASHPTASHVLDLRSIRAEELRVAMNRLGWNAAEVVRLGIPDGEVERHGDRLRSVLNDVLLPGDLCLAPWRRDGHPDHDACGEAARDATRLVGAHHLGYLVWAWHWADPLGADLPWRACRRFEFDRRAARRESAGPPGRLHLRRARCIWIRGCAVVPAPLLRRFWRPFEVFVDEGADGS